MSVRLLFFGDGGGEDEFAWFDRIQYDLRCRMRTAYVRVYFLADNSIAIKTKGLKNNCASRIFK